MNTRKLKIISADERLSARRGAKLVIAGPTGVGKTSLVRTIDDPNRLLFLDSESGDLSIQDVPVATIRIDDWQVARDVACRICGPNPSFGPLSCYSQAHYNDLLRILWHNWDAFSPLFAISRTQIKRTLERINYGLRRYLAHPHKASRHGYEFGPKDIAAVETGLALVGSAPHDV